MAVSRETSVLCQELIGREAYLEQFRRLLASAAARRGAVVAISGEAGVGKSRLAAELKAIAQSPELRFDVASGSSFEFDTSTPYAPIVDMLRGCMLHRTAEQIRACVALDGPELLRILPELSPALPGVEPAQPRDRDLDKRQLFAAISNVLLRLAVAAPLLLVLEDVHWSDDASMEFLLQFARHLSSSPVVLVLNFRADEVQPSLRKLLAATERERVLADWRLDRLAPDEIGAMVATMFALRRPPSPETIEHLRQLTEGNPFFIEEILTSMVSAGEVSPDGIGIDRISTAEVPVPRSVQAAVQERTEGLSRHARDVVRLASISGRRFDFRLLGPLSGLAEAELLAVIKELIGAQLVVEESADHFSFRHALTQQAIYSELLARERRTLHGRIGAAIQTVYADSLDAHLTELAHHFNLAEQWDEAYFYGRRAGERALALNAPQSAHELLTRVLAAAGELKVTPPATVYRMRGHALEALGEFEGARADYEHALALAKVAADGAAEWQALIDLGFLWAGRAYQRAGDYFQQASDLADLLDDEELRSRSLNRLGNWLVNVGRGDEAIPLHERALAIAVGRGDLPGQAATLDLLGMANGLHGNQPQALARYRESRRIFRELGDRDGLATALAGAAAWYSPQLSEASHVAAWDEAEAVSVAREGVTASEAISSLPAQMFAHMSACQLLTDIGLYVEARAHAETVRRLATETGHQQWRAAGEWELGVISFRTFAIDEAVSRLKLACEIAREVGSMWWIGNTTAYLARAFLLRGDAETARQVLEPVRPQGDLVRLGTGLRRVCVAWSETLLAGGEHDAALDVVDRLIATAPEATDSARMPVLRLLRGQILAASKHPDLAIEELVRARDDARASATLTIRWTVERALASVYLMLKQVDDAERSLGNARAMIEAITSLNVEDPELADRFQAGALASLPQPRTRTTNQAAKAQFGGLTAREREVAGLIARGKTNREIADELVLGERTIETHVGNILGKLEFASRAQIAAWAVQIGLAKVEQ